MKLKENFPKRYNSLISKLFEIWKKGKEMARCEEREKPERNSVL